MLKAVLRTAKVAALAVVASEAAKATKAAIEGVKRRAGRVRRGR